MGAPAVTLWWGRPWPREDYRAEICEDDALRVAVPVGYACSLCGVPIEEYDRGISMGGIGADGQFEHVQQHIECSMRNVVGCFDLVSTGAVWMPGHVCSGPENYREDALKVWAWVHTHPGVLRE